MINKNKIDIVYKSLKDLKPYKKNPRKITDKAIEVVKNSIEKFGIKNPIIIDKNNEIVCGHTRHKALCLLQIESPDFMNFDHIPCIDASDLTAQEIKAFRIADNKTAEFSLWDDELLQVEIEDIPDIDLGDFGMNYIEEVDCISEDIEVNNEKKSKKVKCPKCGFAFEV